VIQIKRIYESPAETDGFRVLIDRLWPRGVSKEKAAINLWLKEVAPSSYLRTWFGHKPERFEEFTHMYLDELAGNPAADQLIQLARSHKVLTLLFAAKDETNNDAVVLRNFLEGKL
jgi:uncharacterized protein YeaO (DUF488 family)